MAILSTIVSIFYVILLVVVLLLVIADNSPTPNKLAWILILAAFPVLGLVLYFLVGFSIREKWKYEKRHESSLKVFMEQRTPELSDLIYGDGGDLVDERWRPLVKLLSGPMSRAHCGNSYEIITKGERKLELLLQDLAAAKHSIHVEYFHFGNDEAARKIKELLMQKAREGVQVRFIYERLANFPIPSRYYYEMKKAGVQIVRYKGPHGGLLSHVTTLNYRDHRKIMLIDGKIGYTGGMNLNKNYFYIWKDAHFLFGERKDLVVEDVGIRRRRGEGEPQGAPLFEVFLLRLADSKDLELRAVFGDAERRVDLVERADLPRVAALGEERRIAPENGADLAVRPAEKDAEIRFPLFRLPLFPFEKTGEKDPPLVVHHFGKKNERLIL